MKPQGEMVRTRTKSRPALNLIRTRTKFLSKKNLTNKTL